jgi:aspartate/methionine/tyrosine aminotransferase
MRKTIYTALSDPAVPCDVNVAVGAFYFFLRVHARLDAMTMTERLIREHGIAVIPGSAFGATDGCYLRISYGALDERTVEEGTRRLVAGLRALA